MRKMRSDSTWSKLTPKQRRLMDEWYFESGLSHTEIIEEAEREFGITATQQTLTSYFRYRERARELAGPVRISRADAELARRMKGMKLEELEIKAVYFAAVTAYEMAQAAPDTMRVKELRSLIKLLSDRRYALGNFRAKREKFEFQKFVALTKLERGASKFQTKEEFETMMFETADILQRTKQKTAEAQAAFEADQKSRAEASSAKAEPQTRAEAAEEMNSEAEKPGDEMVQAGDKDPNRPRAEGPEEVYKDINKAI